MEADGRSRLSKKFGKRFGRKEDEKITAQDIMQWVDLGVAQGSFSAGQREMIANIFEFQDMTVEEVMTHRVDIVAVEENASISTVVFHALNDGFTRIPVFKEDIDNIIGVVYVKDMLTLIGEEKEDVGIGQFIREIMYVPESARCRETFKQFTDKHQHIAVVVDEYGGTSGIVTLENLLESIVGEIQDEYDDETEEITRVNDTTFIMEGWADLDDVAEILDIEVESNPDCDTVGGFLIDRLGRIPDSGEHPVVAYQGVEFTVLVVEERHIAKVRAVKLQKTQSHSLDEENALK